MDSNNSPETQEWKGRITRWVGGKWGIANFYRKSFDSAPEKVFVHVSKVVTEEKPQMGSRILFQLGPRRSPTELPAALQIKVISSPAESV